MVLSLIAVAATLFDLVASHGAMITPAPRQAHGQTWDARNQCGCESKPAGCYSNATRPGDYCGVGCVGEACLYYQIGCFQNTSVCSLKGKTLYPVLADLGGQPVPPAPTLGGGDPQLEHTLRTMNIDNSSKYGDWTRWMPWRAPGSTGYGNPNFQPCGINSGASTDPPFPSAHGQVPGAKGSDLPPLGPMAAWPTWESGSVQEVEFSIYANHGGGYSYRLCKNDGNPMTEHCYQQTPLDFATDESTVHYWDDSQPDLHFEAVTTKIGTFPKNSMWRKNPVPMCNCDVGTGCGGKDSAGSFEAKVLMKARATQDVAASGTGKSCIAVTPDQCGNQIGVNTCEKCGPTSGPYDCLKCCPGTTRVTKGGYSWCAPSKPGPPSPPPSSKCDPTDPSTARNCYFVPYPASYLTPGQKIAECPTGLQYPTAWPQGAGAGIGGVFNWSIKDKVQIPAGLTPGAYSVSWRWDCEETPQVWNSCADVVITA